MPTHNSSRNGCLDHFSLRNRLNTPPPTTKLVINNVPFSDHKIIKTDITFQFKITRSVISTSFSFINNNLILEKLSTTNWNDLFKINCTDLAFSEFLKKLQSIINESTIIKKIKNDKNIKMRSPWASKELAILSKEKENCYKKLKKNPCDNQLKLQLKQISDEVANKVKQEKFAYYGKLLSEHSKSSKEYWKIVNNVLGRKTVSNIQALNINGTDLQVEGNEEIVANEFVNYFGNVVKNISKNFSDKNQITVPAQSFFSNSFFCQPIMETEIMNAINNMTDKNSKSLDNISPKFLKKFKNYLITPLCFLFNLSIKEGIFPSQLKKARVVPIFKQGSPRLVQNYRPISILSPFSKIFETIIKQKILYFLIRYEFFAPNQFGFLPKKNTDLAIVSKVKLITAALESNLKVSAIYFDLCKAFDVVNHALLIKKLELYGFRGVFLNWLKTYLVGREHQVSIGEKYSQSLLVESGVPQGSVLGPLFFLIFVNDLFNLKINGKIFSFADDTALIVTEKSENSLIEKLKTDCEAIRDWFYMNKMEINVEKTKVTPFHSKII